MVRSGFHRNIVVASSCSPRNAGARIQITRDGVSRGKAGAILPAPTASAPSRVSWFEPFGFVACKRADGRRPDASCHCPGAYCDTDQRSPARHEGIIAAPNGDAVTAYGAGLALK